jgi:phosphomethylpyrimidine synthase
MTQLEAARKGVITEEMKICAEREGVSSEFIRKGVEDGFIVVIRNIRHTNIIPLAIGKGLKTKINANIGTSIDRIDLNMELEKVRVSVAAGADTIMDLSTGGDIRAFIRLQLK